MSPKKVIVAMSGGVDSSVAALLLREAGYRVLGVHFRQGDYEGDCCHNRGLIDARRVALELDIDFHVINCEKGFQREVIAYFCRTYAAGRTPNPCLNCNSRVRFPRLIQLANLLNFDFVATGHYARVAFDSRRHCYCLGPAVSRAKDQSYFLSGLKQQWLRSIIWPLGGLSKNEVREIARKRVLPVSEKPDSQEVCFIPRGGQREFLKKAIPNCCSPGPIIDAGGRRLGTHPGLPFYTVGQRRGLGISAPQPLYVLGLEPENNTVRVGREEETYSSAFTASHCNWLEIAPREDEFRARIMIRSRHRPGPGRVRRLSEGRAEVKFDRPQAAITPGQGAAFYREERLLGGAIIEKVMAG